LAAKQRTEVAVDFRRRRDGDDIRVGSAYAGSLVIDKEKGLILTDRTAEDAAELVLLKRRFGLIGWFEEAARVERRVSQELERGAMELVRA
jgi:hypothetical protein